MAIDPTADGHAMVRSSDGKSWSEVTTPEYFVATDLASDGAGDFLAAGGTASDASADSTMAPTVLASTDNGKDWTDVTGRIGLATSDPATVSVGTDGAGKWVVIDPGFGEAVYTDNIQADDFKTWTRVQAAFSRADTGSQIDVASVAKVAGHDRNRVGLGDDSPGLATGTAALHHWTDKDTTSEPVDLTALGAPSVNPLSGSVGANCLPDT